MPQKIENLNKEELRSLAASNNVEASEDTTKDQLVERLHERGVTHSQTQEESDERAEERAEAVGSSEGGFAGGTAGGASESQQPTAAQAEAVDDANAERDRAAEAGDAGEAEVPEYDTEIAMGVTPRQATPPNPALDYDDDRKAQEGEEGVDPAASRESDKADDGE